MVAICDLEVDVNGEEAFLVSKASFLISSCAIQWRVWINSVQLKSVQLWYLPRKDVLFEDSSVLEILCCQVKVVIYYQYIFGCLLPNCFAADPSNSVPMIFVLLLLVSLLISYKFLVVLFIHLWSLYLQLLSHQLLLTKSSLFLAAFHKFNAFGGRYKS